MTDNTNTIGVNYGNYPLYPLADEYLKESIHLVREVETMTKFGVDKAKPELLVKLAQLRTMIGEYLKATR